MVVHNSLDTSSKSFCTSGVCNTDYHWENNLSQTTGLNLVPNLPKKLYMIMLHQMAHYIPTNATARAIFQYHNPPLPEINLSPVQMLFSRQLSDHLPVKPCYCHLHKDWIIFSEQN